MAKDLGKIHVYTGDGKGKTTAALGLALRAIGAGYQVYIVQFMKGQDYSELTSLKKIKEITLKRFGQKSFVHGRGTRKDKELAQKGDIYINDAFGVCHRNHASVSAITKYLPSGAGFLLEKEVTCLTRLSANPEKPLVAIIGGAKIETKVGVIDKISEKADFVLISGLIGKEVVGQKIVLRHPEKIVFPVDETGEGKDVGTETVRLFKEKIVQAKTIFWNGPLGKIENEEFAVGTEEIAKAIAQSPAFSVVGGGETVEFITKLGLVKKFSHVSSGGGAMLAFLSGEKLPGLEALR